jgi:hypothetical protein
VREVADTAKGGGPMLGPSTMKIGCGNAWDYADKGGPPQGKTPTSKRSSPTKQQAPENMGASQGMNELTAELYKLRTETEASAEEASLEPNSYYRNVRPSRGSRECASPAMLPTWCNAHLVDFIHFSMF